MQKYGKFVETRFHELEDESKMRLLKPQFHTSERLDYEADKGRQRERSLSVGDRKKTSNESTAVSPKRRAGRECDDRKSENRGSATTLARGGEAKMYDQKIENERSHGPVLLSYHACLGRYT